MNKKIKVIELLNKIANGEELPKSIKYCGFIWQLYNGNYVENGQRMLEDYLANGIVESLNDEVEILENTEEIEELPDDIDEEREALRNFKSEYETCNHNSSDLIIELDDAKIILNLIEKYQKEIEE